MTKGFNRNTLSAANITDKCKTAYQTFIGDANGAFSIMWACSFLGVMTAIGGAYDLAQFSRAKALAQYTADNMALTASIAIDMENGNKYTQVGAGDPYPFSEIGGVGNDFTNSITGTVDYEASDADGALLARATVTGTYKPAFLGLLKMRELTFTATADVAYAQKQVMPASVFLILDNSGSMAWDDSAGNPKIDGLKATVQEFMDDLLVLTEDEDPAVLRTAMLNFSTPNVITQTDQTECAWVSQPDQWSWWSWSWVPQPDRWQCNAVFVQTSNDAIYDESIVVPNWGVVPDDMINLIVANGGTDPSDALEQAYNWMSQNESGLNGAHDMENGEKDPLRFVIVMTDGRIESNSNANALVQSQYYCSELKSLSNSFVYTIGYDLTVGNSSSGGRRGRRGGGGNNAGNNNSQQDVDAANAFLEDCATDADHNIPAADSDELSDAFATIGEKIIEEVIRVKS